MSRAVYVAGAGCGERSTKRVVSVLGDHYDQARGFTLAEFMAGQVNRCELEGSALWGYSAGALAAYAVSPGELESLTLCSAPLKRSLAHLALQTALKPHRHFIAGHTISEFARLVDLTAEAGKEITKVMVAHFLATLRVTGFDAIEAASLHQDAGTEAIVVWTKQEDYFRPSKDTKCRADQAGVSLLEIDGTHEQLALNPGRFIGQVMAVRHSRLVAA
jgi:hypothetical protein